MGYYAAVALPMTIRNKCNGQMSTLMVTCTCVGKPWLFRATGSVLIPPCLTAATCTGIQCYIHGNKDREDGSLAFPRDDRLSKRTSGLSPSHVRSLLARIRVRRLPCHYTYFLTSHRLHGPGTLLICAPQSLQKQSTGGTSSRVGN